MLQQICQYRPRTPISHPLFGQKPKLDTVKRAPFFLQVFARAHMERIPNRAINDFMSLPIQEWQKYKRRNRGNSFLPTNKAICTTQHKSITTFEIIQKMILQRRLQYFHRSPWKFVNSALAYLSLFSHSSYLITALFRLSFSSFNLVMLSWAARLIPFNSSIFSSIASSVIVYTQSPFFQTPYLTSFFHASQSVY